MKQTISATIQVRRDTAENWAAVDPILEDGEQIIVRSPDGDKMKIGDGVRHYSALPFLSAGGGAEIVRW